MKATSTTTKGKQRIDYSEAEQMLRAGKTQQEVAEHFGATQSAIGQAVRRGRIKLENPKHASGRAMPWRVSEEHHQKYLARMLRSYHRQEQGLPNAAPLQRMLDSFLKSMEEADAVVHYDPDLEEGFIRVKRRPGVDDHPLIRRDDLDDDGKPLRPKPKHLV